MKSRSGEKIKLMSVDELLGVPDGEPMIEIPIDNIREFKDHPFKVLEDEKMKELVSSILANGILTPVIVREDENGDYETTTPEPITNNSDEITNSVYLTSKNHDIRKREYYFQFNTKFTEKILLLEPKLVLYDDYRELMLNHDEWIDEKYYVYAQGRFQGTYESATQAILQAYDLMGTVIDRNRQYIWQRGNRKTRTQITDFSEIVMNDKTNLQICIELMLTYNQVYTNVTSNLLRGESAYQILEQELGAKVLDLSGCSVKIGKAHV